MDYGYFGFNHGALHDADSITRVVVAAEELGYESIWTGEKFRYKNRSKKPENTPSP